ncbi:MAG: hypothetical protein IPM35_11530 [Myxococcales bacterium]|nr:hypothetical protein [Myxococcales bacterium]
MTAFLAGARLVRLRLLSVASVLGLGVALLSVFVVALLERRAGSIVAADRALTGVALGFVLPLLAHGTVARALAGARLDAALGDIGRWGGDRRTGALGVALSLSLVLGLAGALIAALAVGVVRAPADPLLWRDTLTSAWIGALAGASYAGWFCLGSTLGKRGGGRGVVLIVDWIAGASAGAAALFWPRGHVRNLLGAEPVLAMPQWTATLALVVLGSAYVALSAWRVRR